MVGRARGILARRSPLLPAKQPAQERHSANLRPILQRRTYWHVPDYLRRSLLPASANSSSTPRIPSCTNPSAGNSSRRSTLSSSPAFSGCIGSRWNKGSLHRNGISVLALHCGLGHNPLLAVLARVHAGDDLSVRHSFSQGRFAQTPKLRRISK